MPLLFRSMQADGDKPRIGCGSATLGVRVSPDSQPDLPVAQDGSVQPCQGGMSVVPHWKLLPVSRIPKRLRPLFPAAVGANNLCCWRLGEGPFVAGAVSQDLSFRPDPQAPESHGFVEPGQVMALAAYQQALADTQDLWIRDEG